MPVVAALLQRGANVNAVTGVSAHYSVLAGVLLDNCVLEALIVLSTACVCAVYRKATHRCTLLHLRARRKLYVCCSTAMLTLMPALRLFYFHLLWLFDKDVALSIYCHNIALFP